MAMKPHGRPADVFSLGVLLLELTVGAPSEDPTSLVLKVYMHMVYSFTTSHSYMYNKILSYDSL